MELREGRHIDSLPFAFYLNEINLLSSLQPSLEGNTDVSIFIWTLTHLHPPHCSLFYTPASFSQTIGALDH